MTFEQAFGKIKEKFVNADASKTPNFAMQITLTDEDCGGTLYAAVKDGVLAVEPFDYYDNTSVLNITKSALLAILAGRSSLDKAIANNDAVIKGNTSDLAELKSTLKKSAPAKKTPAKKTSAKKAVAVTKTTKGRTAKTTPAKADTAVAVVKETAKATAPAKKTASKTTAAKKTK